MSQVLVKRKVRLRQTTVGPREDPYARAVWTVWQKYTDGTDVTIELTECALAGRSLEVLYSWPDARPPVREEYVDSDARIDQTFFEAVGCAPEAVFAAYARLHPYVPEDDAYPGWV